jgi:hypothetical protein
MHKSALFLACAAALGLSAPAHADDTQAWGKVAVTVVLKGPWRLSNEAEIRVSDAKGLYEVENNLLLGYKTGNVTLATGYTHDPNYSHGTFTSMEHRIRSQVSVDNFAALGPVRLSGRMRVETRWRDNTAGTGWRLRPYLKASMPVHGKTALNLATEPFIDLGRTSFQKTDGLDKQRTWLTISTPIARNLTIEAGYMNQHTYVRRGADNDDHVASLTLSATF